MRRKITTAALVAVGLAGLFLLSEGTYMKAKAELAHVLLQRAWHKTQAGDMDAKPWPWADMAPAYALDVPARGASTIVLGDASGEALAFAPGWMPTTAKPGSPGLAVIAAHRDTHFSFLKEVTSGDEIRLTHPSGLEDRFVVEERRIVSAQASGLERHMQGSWLALSTCWPLDAKTPGDERLVVLARKLAA
ncbi:MAG: class GN sortase [Pseudomonadota bacterium]